MTRPPTTAELLDELFNRVIDNVDNMEPDEIFAVLETMRFLKRTDRPEGWPL